MTWHNEEVRVELSSSLFLSLTRRRPGKPELPGQRQCSSDKPCSGKSWSLVPELWKSMRTNSAHNGQDMDRREKAGINFLWLKTTKASTLVKNVLAFVWNMMVPVAGLEPARPQRQRILNP